MVFVLNVDGAPLMPCQAVVARLLLKSGDATVVRVTPFTIKLAREPETMHVEELTLGVDAGSRKGGFGVTDADGNVFYASEVELRQDITKKMDRRRKYRRSRRGRKCRYREPRFLNRGNSIKAGRLPPTLRSKIDAHAREIECIKKLLPIAGVVIEAGTFDPHALANPDVLNDPVLYQRGLQYGFNNTKAYVLHRDDYTCQHCKGRSGDSKLHCHHVAWKSNGGSDRPDNLLVLCETCHLGVHDASIELNARGKRKGSLHHATHQNVINKRLLERYPDASETFGYITKTHREHLGLPKTHYNDAI
ncbi:HNH endonuclease, partial [Candidatus Bathyarchaeota archaeon]|nr:HNH endonuclease [Candidatus Bathyarchaeota archaeon]